MGLEMLPSSGMLGRMSPEAVSAMASYAVEFPVAAGEIVIRQGQEQFDLYFLIIGQMDVLAEVNEKMVPLAEVRPGECFGEISIFQPGPASATVKARCSCVLWKLDADHLQGFLENYPREASGLLLGVCEILAQRLRHGVQVVKQTQVMPSFLSIRSRLRQQGGGGGK